MKTQILYHANCPDGFCAAWVAWRKLGDDAEYIPVQYGQPPPDVAGNRVFILDFSYKREIMREILSSAMFVCVLDHHKTADAELAGIVDEFAMRPDLIANPPGSHLPSIRFDMGKSGGRLAWEYFNPGEAAPWLVRYTEDRDLWRWELHESRNINAGLGSWPRDFAVWSALETDPHALYDLSKAGGAINRHIDQQTAAIVRGAREVEIGGHKIKAANSSVLFSEVAEVLSDGRAFGAVWFVRADGKQQWSLRSRDGGADVAAIARSYGGGGHAQAAGFEREPGAFIL